jgi:hypothetical protein
LTSHQRLLLNLLYGGQYNCLFYFELAKLYFPLGSIDRYDLIEEAVDLLYIDDVLPPDGDPDFV